MALKEEANESMDTSELDHSSRPTEPVTDKGDYEALCEDVNIIAKPLATRKVAKKVYKLIKKASKEKKCLEKGLNDVQRAMKKGEKGIVVLAGDVSPIDVYSHLPTYCEELGLPYVFTPARSHLGLAAGVARSVIVILIKPNEAYQDAFDELSETIKCMVIE
ncbi:H/ACA ribonucleoprotein complex subunit 2 [Strongyloides ratti]|uniref:H/ACA ribonucleoprotein complex subunit 2 n=1 Tax=Strongyloides ratti TaxID=34506 RepID=A0A090L872_STRRB|nr:H/ACA ribonucleoprotein complex subunit 2 [Strongyloides ratti]CEF65947.1 H/ACA ribonucleoprotein complex subunit 2 [Strongyloides ratti]